MQYVRRTGKYTYAMYLWSIEKGLFIAEHMNF
jgi:hypothetical protein